MQSNWSVDPLPSHGEVAIWRFWLTHLLDWSEAQVLEYAEKFRDGILNENSLHYHEHSEYWIAPLLVPREIVEAQLPFVVTRVSWAIEALLVRYRRTYGLNDAHLNELRSELERAVSQPRCTKCGLELRESKERCPECGTPIVPKA